VGHLQRETAKSAAQDAAEALKDLNMLGAIMALCESSLFSSDCHSAESEIIRVCKRHSARALDRYDAALALVETRKA